MDVRKKSALVAAAMAGLMASSAVAMAGPLSREMTA